MSVCVLKQNPYWTMANYNGGNWFWNMKTSQSSEEANSKSVSYDICGKSILEIP